MLNQPSKKATAVPAADIAPSAGPKKRRGPSRGVEAAAVPGPDALPSGLAGATYPIQTTMPDRVLRHDISDEELGILYEPRRKNLSEAKWAFFGMAGGALPAGIAALYTFFSATEPLKAVDLIQIVVLFVSSALAAMVWKIDSRLCEQPSDLASEIRARTKRISG